MKIRRIPFYSVFLLHFLVVLFLCYYLAVNNAGVSLWICAGIGFTCGFMQLYTPRASYVKLFFTAISPILILFLITYFTYQDFRILSEDKRNSVPLVVRAFEHLSHLNKKVFTNMKNIFLSKTEIENWCALAFGFFISRVLSFQFLKSLREKEESSFEDGSILKKRYQGGMSKFKRRF